MNDSRGNHTNRPHRLTESAKEKIRDHIRKFPVMESHYYRAESQR